MRQFIIPVLAGLLASCAQSVAQSPEYKEHISKAFTLPNGTKASTLVIYNINGAIKVEGTSGNNVSVEVDERLTAKENDVLEIGKKEFKLAVEQHGDTIIAYIAEPFDSRPHNELGHNDRHIDYDFTLDFTVRVPHDMNLRVSTVNRGDIVVTDVAGALKVSNVNGAIALTNVRGTTDVHTINGDVTANYLASPPAQSAYYTLNGNIRVTYPANLSADFQFKTFHGEFYTDFTNTEILPAQVVKQEERTGEKTTYKLNKTTAIRIGTGGKTLRFETFNGSVYVKQKS